MKVKLPKSEKSKSAKKKLSKIKIEFEIIAVTQAANIR